jgi:hypothetical protein
MTTPDPMKAITQELRSAIDDPGDVEALPAGRDAAIARIADALRARSRARRRERLRAPLLVAAALVLVSAGAFAFHRAQRDAASGATARTGTDLGRLGEQSGAVTALRDGHAEAVSRGARLGEGTELRTSGSSEASLDFDSGTHVTVGGASRVRLVEQTARKRFALEAGSFSAKVAKLGPDERFVVTTPDAEVEVRGTAFRVTLVPSDPGCEGGTPTRLEVTEGVVVVTHAGTQVRVGAGSHWPECAVTAAASPSTSAAPALAARPASSSTRPAVATTGARPAASSHLAEQNDLFDEAVRRERAGDAAGAVRQLDRLLTTFPGGPLSESAAAKRMRLLATSDPARAAGAARSYLSSYPQGFARAEAEAIVAGHR